MRLHKIAHVSASHSDQLRDLEEIINRERVKDFAGPCDCIKDYTR